MLYKRPALPGNNNYPTRNTRFFTSSALVRAGFQLNVFLIRRGSPERKNLFQRFAEAESDHHQHVIHQIDMTFSFSRCIVSTCSNYSQRFRFYA